MKNNNQINVPQAREAMDRFKMQAGSVGGQMVPIRTMNFTRHNRIATDHIQTVQYITRLTI